MDVTRSVSDDAAGRGSCVECGGEVELLVDGGDRPSRPGSGSLHELWRGEPSAA